MAEYLLDSCVIIWALRGRKEILEGLAALDGVPGASALSVYEVEVGMKAGEETRTQKFLSALRLHPVTPEVASLAARFVREYRARGTTLDPIDALIAATAVLLDLVLLTKNIRHFPMPELRKLDI